MFDQKSISSVGGSFFLMFDDTREPPPAAALRVSPNAVLESIDSGDFLARVMRLGIAIALRRRGAITIAACARRSLPRNCGG